MKKLNIIIATTLALWAATANAQMDLQPAVRQIGSAPDTEDVPQAETRQIGSAPRNDSFSRATTFSQEDKEKLNKQITDFKKK